MRVLFFARNTVSHPRYGGMEVVLDALATALSREGVDVALVTTLGFHRGAQSTGPYSATWEVPGTVVGRYSRRWWRATRLPGPWDDWNADVVVGIGDAGGGFALRRDRVPAVVIQSHGTPTMEAASAFSTASTRGLAQGTLNLMRFPSRRRFYRAADAVWAVGDRVAEQITTFYRSAPTTYAPNAIDTSTFTFDLDARARARTDLNLKTNDHVALFAARIEKQKGADLAIELMRSRDTAQADALLIAGTGSDEARLRSMVSAARLDDRVHFLGALGRADMPAIYSAADVLLLPTRRREGMPMSVLEGAATGLPILTTATASVPSDISTSGSVSILEFSNIDAWSRSLEASKRQSSRDSYLPSQYSLETYGARHHVLLKEALSARSGRMFA